MATKGTPYEGRDRIIAPRVYSPGAGAVVHSLVAYCNLQNSLSDLSVYADLVQPTGNGYAPITLSGVWSSSQGIVTYDHGTPDDPRWQNVDASLNWSQPVTGAAIVATIGGVGPYLVHFMDFADGPVTMTPQQRIVVNLSTLVAP